MNKNNNTLSPAMRERLRQKGRNLPLADKFYQKCDFPL